MTIEDEYHAALFGFETSEEKEIPCLHSDVCSKIGVGSRGPSDPGYLAMVRLSETKRIQILGQVKRDPETQYPWTDWLVRVG